jgi:hypothetical protein
MMEFFNAFQAMPERVFCGGKKIFSERFYKIPHNLFVSFHILPVPERGEGEIAGGIQRFA